MRFRQIILACAFALGEALLSATAIAQESQAGLVMAFPLGSKTVTIVRGSNNFDCDDCQATASVDGRVLAVDAGVYPRRRYTDAEVDAVVLELNNLGSGLGCVTRYTIAWVSKAGAFGTTAPFYDKCYEDPDFIITPGQIIVRFPPWIRRDGLIYRWTFKGGLEAPAVEECAPDLHKDWDWLREGFDEWDVFENAGVYSAFKIVLGPDFEEFRTYFDRNLGMETIADDVIIGAASTRLWDPIVFAIDPKRERVFAAIPAREGWRFYPDEAEWPAGLKSQLAAKFPQETEGFASGN